MAKRNGNEKILQIGNKLQDGVWTLTFGVIVGFKSTILQFVSYL